jgi:phosphate:Na+ symporter
MSFAAQGVVPPQAAFALVLGANLGTALNPLFEAGLTGDPSARRLPIGNLLNRLVGCILGLALLGVIGRWLVAFEPDASRAVADFHTLFNLVMAALFFPVLGPLARLLRRLLPARAVPSDPSRPVYLDQDALEIPAIAIAAASREALRMADVLEAMIRAALEGLDRGDRKSIAETKRLDDVLDRLNSAIKAYLTSLDHETIDGEDDQRLPEVLAFITNLEQATLSNGVWEQTWQSGPNATSPSHAREPVRSTRCCSVLRPTCVRPRPCS